MVVTQAHAHEIQNRGTKVCLPFESLEIPIFTAHSTFFEATVILSGSKFQFAKADLFSESVVVPHAILGVVGKDINHERRIQETLVDLVLTMYKSQAGVY